MIMFESESAGNDLYRVICRSRHTGVKIGATVQMLSDEGSVHASMLFVAQAMNDVAYVNFVRLSEGKFRWDWLLPHPGGNLNMLSSVAYPSREAALREFRREVIG